MLRASYPYYLANEPVPTNTNLAVTNKYALEVATDVSLADGGSTRVSVSPSKT